MNVIKMTDLDLKGKRVLIRSDLNVPVQDGKVTSDARICASMGTIQHALDTGARVMVTSHLGRPEEGVKKTGFALVTLKTPLAFNHEDNDPVDILITMAAVDANTHQEVGIMQIDNQLDHEANFYRFRACRTAQDVLDLIDHATAAAV